MSIKESYCKIDLIILREKQVLSKGPLILYYVGDILMEIVQKISVFSLFLSVVLKDKDGQVFFLDMCIQVVDSLVRQFLFLHSRTPVPK